MTASHVTWAETVNPPWDDPTYPDRVAADLERLRSVTEDLVAPRLAVVDEAAMPEVPEAEQRKLAGMMVEGLSGPLRRRVVRLQDVTPERVSWAWQHRMAFGKVTVLDGDPGLGKSTISLDVAARLSTGRQLPGEVAEIATRTGVVILSAEDGLGDTI